jgi:hypothetical protein
MFEKLPVEIIFHIKSFISIWEFFISKDAYSEMKNYLSRKPQYFPIYYRKINLKNKFKLRWKRSYANTFYYRHQKNHFKYFIYIQDDFFQAITICPQWKKVISESECNLIDDYFYSINPDFMTNVNPSFSEIIFFNNVVTHYNHSPLMTFIKLDEIVFMIKNYLEKIIK